MYTLFMEMKIRAVKLDDAPAILSLQKEVFQDVAEIYSHCSIPPMTETIEELEHEIREKAFLKALIDGELAGSVRAYKESGTCYLEKLIVRPSLQGKGIGTKLMQAIEKHYAGRVQRYQLSTVHKSKENICLYEHLGYNTYKTEKVNEDVIFVYMEKPAPDS